MASVSHNPFRTPAVSPNPTGISTNSQPQHAPPSNAPPSPRPDPTGLTEEAPPAYTTRPDVYQGESTLEYGPARPFQPAPPPVQQLQQAQPSPPPQHPGWAAPAPSQRPAAPSLLQQLTGQIAAHVSGGRSISQLPSALWSTYPGSQRQQQPRPPPQQLAPPPPQQQPSPAAPPTTTHGSDFARDFYATTTVPPGAFSDVSGARNTGSAGSGYPPPPTAATAPYQPPPGAPPRTPSPAGGLPDDGRPTHTPVPGHPLLHNGEMLVYPPHYECHRCNNTGYKHADPTRPCHKCWSRYARPYAGALVYAPDAPNSGPGPHFSANAHAHSTTFQRPLPRLYAPPGRAFLSAPACAAAAAPVSASYPPRAPASVYAPGDARMGGAPCWRCGGRGTLSFLVFDTVSCVVCRGVGRVFA